MGERDAVVAWLLPANPGRGVAGGVVSAICGIHLFDLALQPFFLRLLCISIPDTLESCVSCFLHQRSIEIHVFALCAPIAYEGGANGEKRGGHNGYVPVREQRGWH